LKAAQADLLKQWEKLTAEERKTAKLFPELAIEQQVDQQAIKLA
jgi:hypothetical protein